MEIKGKVATAVCYAKVIEDEAVEQIRRMCDFGFTEGAKVRIMPDVHAGAGCTVGTTMTIKDTAVPNIVGVDIGCGMETIKIKETHIELQKLDKLIYSQIPSGFEIRKTPHRYSDKIDLDELYCRNYINPIRAELSIGTLGGGNHFIEADKGSDGSIYIVIHSGSRHLGLETAKYYQNEAYNRLNKSDGNASEEIIKKQNIGVNPNLPMVPPSNEVTVKSLETICKRYIASIVTIQIVFELGNDSSEGIEFFTNLLKQFDVMDSLNAKEKSVLAGSPTQQECTDVVWEYECCCSLAWALGLIDNMDDNSCICDCEKLVRLVSGCNSQADFISKCKLRDTEEILDMLDLFYRYHWATVQKKWIDPKLPIGDLNEEVVFERRRGLEWLIAEETDWHDIMLNT